MQDKAAYSFALTIGASAYNLFYVILVNMVLGAIIAGALSEMPFSYHMATLIGWASRGRNPPD
jgi:hypothetical protein